MIKFKYIIIILFFLFSCNKAKKIPESLINTNHLEHLYQEVKIDSARQFGTIWIYSNAPEYKLVTDEDEGYSCIDDASRALVFYCRQYKIEPTVAYLKKIKSLTRFIFFMKADNKYYYNFLFPDDEINRIHKNSVANPNFWTWRAFYALSELCLLSSDELEDIKATAQISLNELLKKLILLFSVNSTTVTVEGIETPKILYTYGADQIALIIAGLTNLYREHPSKNIEDLVLMLGNDLCKVQHGTSKTFPYNSFLSWKNHWHAWGNLQAYALLYASRIFHVERFIKDGLKEVDNFYPYCIKINYLHDFSISEVNDSITILNINKYPQIAYDISPMIFASLEAYRATNIKRYAIQAGQLSTWFFGNNVAKQVMYDQFTGRTFDGIESENKINYNSGAESTIEALLSIQAVESNPISKKIIDNYMKGR